MGLCRFVVEVSLAWINTQYKREIGLWNFDPSKYLAAREDGSNRLKKEDWNSDRLAELKRSEFAYDWIEALREYLIKASHHPDDQMYVAVHWNDDIESYRIRECHNPLGHYEVDEHGVCIEETECKEVYDGLENWIQNYRPPDID